MGTSSTGDVIYLDYNATTPVEQEVVDVITSTLQSCWANPSSSHALGRQARAAVDTARRQLAQMLDADETEIIFTSGGTETNNVVLETAVQHFHRNFIGISGTKQSNLALPHIVTSNIEHDSIKLYLERLVAEGRADVSFVPVSHASCRVEADDVINAIRPNTCLVTIMLANNETGVLQPLSEIARKVRSLEQQRRESGTAVRILLHTDAAQAIGKVPVSAAELQVDYLTVVGHKFYGPRIGALYIRGGCTGGAAPTDCMPPLYPALVGGGQERTLRPGTENTAMIAGLGKAAELVFRNVLRYQQQQADVRDYLEQRLSEVFDGMVQFNGRTPSSCRLPNTSNVSLLDPSLQGNKVLARCTSFIASLGAACHSQAHGTGQHQGSPILLACGVPPEVATNAIRLSVGRETTRDCIDMVVEDLHKAYVLLHAAVSDEQAGEA